MPYSVKGFFEIDEDMVQILLVLEVLFTQDSEVENLFCGASSSSEPNFSHRILRLKICSVVLLPALNPACSSAIISSAWGFSIFKMTFSMTLLE